MMKAFDLQADDYIIKSFTMELVLRRIGAVLRRTKEHVQIAGDENEEVVLRYGVLSLDKGRCKALVSDKAIATTKKEFELLTLLLENPEQVFTREVLLDKIWRKLAWRKKNLYVLSVVLTNMKLTNFNQQVEISQKCLMFKIKSFSRFLARSVDTQSFTKQQPQQA